MDASNVDQVDEQPPSSIVQTHGAKIFVENKVPGSTNEIVHGRSLSLPDGRSAAPRCSDTKGRLSSQTMARQEPEKYLYGWGCITPSLLQPIFNNAKAFVLLATLASIFQGLVGNGLLKVNVTSIERRYKLLSSESGLIISSYDIAGCLCLLPMSYIGGKGHKPRWISVGVLLLGIGSFILATPRFLTGPYEYAPVFKDGSQNTSSGLCQTNGKFSNSSNVSSDYGPCDEKDHNSDAYLKRMKYVLMLGQIFCGIGNTPLSVLAVTFIDESVDRRSYPVYIGVYYLGALLGPAFGFVLGAHLLTIFTNLGETPEDITPHSPKWVGAWWAGFIIAGTLTILLSIPLFGYPRKLMDRPKKSKKKYCCYTAWWRSLKHSSTEDMTRAEATGKYYSKTDPESSFHLELEEKETDPMVNQQEVQTKQESPAVVAPPPFPSTTLFKCFLRDIIEVLSTKAFMALSLSAALYSTLVSGFSTFGPKFIESQLGKSASDAANLFGYVCIPAAAGGMLIGAFLMSGLKMTARSVLKMCILVSAAGLLGHFVLVMNCEDVDLAGVTVPYDEIFKPGDSDAVYGNLSVPAICNEGCACPSNVQFNPICGENNLSYFSPCHAGCSIWKSKDANGERIFENCLCISPGQGPASAKSGTCPKSCQWQFLILFSLFVVILTTFVCTVPGVDLSLRCFPYHQRSLAVGVQWVLIRTLGTIPGPIIFGAMIDGTCLLWGEASCNGERGSCLLYKNSELSVSFVVLSIAYKVAGIFTLFVAFLYIKKDTTHCSTPMQSSSKIVEIPTSSNQQAQQSTSGLHSSAFS